MRISDWSSDVCSSDLFECPEHVVGHDVQGLRNVVRTAALMFDEHRGAVDQDVEIVDRGEAIFRVGRNMDGNFSVRTDIVDRLQALALGQGKAWAFPRFALVPTRARQSPRLTPSP